MKTRVIAGAIILGLGAVTFALAQHETREATPAVGPAKTPLPPDRPTSGGPISPELHAAGRAATRRGRAAPAREHDLARERLSEGRHDKAGL